MALQQNWTLDDIPWQDCQAASVRDSEELYYLLISASFVESTTHLYAGNLIEHFSGDRDVTDWLETYWQPEEMQHGRALAAYVRTVWPEFPWDETYAQFAEEFRSVCQVDMLLPSRSLELVSRCVVEMGTASLYSALSKISSDPVLSLLTRNIFEDEVRHYKFFYNFFLQFRGRDNVGRRKVLGALIHRLRMIEDEDTAIALKHVYGVRHPGATFDRTTYKRVLKRVRAVATRHFPHAMCVKMLIKPLDMSPRMHGLATPVLETIARYVVV